MVNLAMIFIYSALYTEGSDLFAFFTFSDSRVGCKYQTLLTTDMIHDCNTANDFPKTTILAVA